MGFCLTAYLKAKHLMPCGPRLIFLKTRSPYVAQDGLQFSDPSASASHAAEPIGTHHCTWLTGSLTVKRGYWAT